MRNLESAVTTFDFYTFFWLLVIASVVAMAGRYIKVPYALALVVTGLAIGPSHILPQAHLEPHILFTILLPPLLFETAIHMRVNLLRLNWQPIAIYALGGTLLSTLVVGGMIAWILDIPIEIALVFGALISPTDPISVIAILKQLGVGKRLSTIMEAESLFNDGIAIVLFTLLVDAATGQNTSLLDGIQSFFVVVGGGAALGTLLGLVASRLTREFDDHFLEITLTTIVAFGSFLGAEALHVSGVIAVVSAGLIMGSYGMKTGMSATTRLSVSSFWEYAAFIVNSIVFLLVGFEVTLVNLTSKGWAIIGAFAVVLLGRTVAIYGLSPLVNKIHGNVPRKWQHVLLWGGLRGAIPMALVLGLDSNFPGRNDILFLTFGVVLLSLLVQGLTMKPLLRQLKLTRLESKRADHGRLASQILAGEAALEELERLKKRKVLSSITYERLVNEYREKLKQLRNEIDILTLADESLKQAQEKEARRMALLMEKSTLREAERNGLLEEEDLQDLIMEIDNQLENLREEYT